MATINGTSGHDNAALGGTSLIGTSANDNIYGYDGNDFIDGGDGNDYLDGGAGFDVIKGGKGNDTIINGTGSGSLDGGAGHDRVIFHGNDGGGTFNLAAGTAKLGQFGQFFTMKNFESIMTGNGDDNIIGTSGANSIFSGGGNDVVKAGGGNDTIYGGLGNDTIDGGAGNDWIDGGIGDDSIDGGTGNDYIDGEEGDDTIHGGGGKDTIIGGKGEDVLFGDAGNDQLYGGSGDDTINGDAGNDWLDGGSGDDTVNGGAGNDTIYGGDGLDTIDGGAGFDTLSYALRPGGVSVYIVQASNKGQTDYSDSDNNDYFQNIEKIVGSNYDDRMQAGATTELDGGAGDDTIYSGRDANKLTGGEGNDTLSYFSSLGAVTVNLGTGKASGGWAQGDKFSGFENLAGTPHYNNTLTGSSGDNRITGGSYDDTLNGGGGADTLIGSGGRDQIKGGSGDDVIDGGGGADILWGGSGADRFRYDDVSNSGTDANQMDVIRDFSRSQGDKIDLSALPGNLSFVGTTVFSAANQVRFQQSGGNTLVEVNTAGNSGAEMAIQLSGSINLQASDFLL